MVHNRQSRGGFVFVRPATVHSNGCDGKKSAKNRKNHKNRTETTPEAIVFQEIMASFVPDE
jgi:hypothetical protein